MKLTSSETFCVRCHAMEGKVFREYRRTIHHSNRSGVGAKFEAKRV